MNCKVSPVASHTLPAFEGLLTSIQPPMALTKQPMITNRCPQIRMRESLAGHR